MKLLILSVISLYLPCTAFFGGGHSWWRSVGVRNTIDNNNRPNYIIVDPLITLPSVFATRAKSSDNDGEPAKKSRGRPKAGSTDGTAAPAAASSEARKGMLGRLKKAATASSPVNEVVPTTAAKKPTIKTATTKSVEATADGSIKKRGKAPKSPATEMRIPPSTANTKTGASTSSSSSVSTGAFDDDESFDLKELLGEDFLSEGIENLLPNLDEDLAKLEANLGDLGDFEFDVFDDDEDGLPSLGGGGANGGLSLSETDLDETLRSIEAGKFDIDEFLQAEGEEGLGMDDIDGLDIDLEVATSSIAGRGSGGLGRGGRTGRGGRGKAGEEAAKKSAIKGRAVGARDEDEEDEDVMEEDVLEDEDLALALGGLIEREDDPMMDVVGLDEEDDEEEDEDEEEEEEEDDGGARRRAKVSGSRTRSAAATTATAGGVVEATKSTTTEIIAKDVKVPSSDIIVAAATATTASASAITTTTVATAVTSIEKPSTDDVSPLVIDGIELDRDDIFEPGVDPPPLEEFKRLMESLGPESMFSDDYAEFTAEANTEVHVGKQKAEYHEPSPVHAVWRPVIYQGGKESRPSFEPVNTTQANMDWWLAYPDGPANFRVQVTAVVTNSSKNTTALEIVQRVYSHIEKALTDDEMSRMNFQIISFENENGVSLDALDDQIQMWAEGYNTYHLVDGAAMKEAWGAIMPHIMLSEKNLDAILDQIRWALAEDTFDGTILTPRLRRLRFRGGAQAMTTGFNTEHLDVEFSTVSVR